MFSGIPLRAISQEVLMNLIRKICLEIAVLRLRLLHIPEANELKDADEYI